MLSYSMNGLVACPAMPIHQDYANHFPPQTVTHQRFARFLLVSLAPKQDDPHRMRDVRKPHLFAEVPIPPLPHAHRFLCSPRNLPRHILEFLLLARVHDLAVQLQIAHIRSLLALQVVEHLRTGEIAIKREGPRDTPRQGIIDQLDTQLRMVFEFLGGTGIPFFKPTPLDRIVRSRWADVVRDHIVMRDHMALVSMIPEPAYVVDQLALMIHQG